MKFVDLFSCGGGMSSGFISTGEFETIGAVDLEVAKPSHPIGATSCNDTYEENLGLRPLSADLAITSPQAISSHFGFESNDVDVLISCAPCTGFSQKRASNHKFDDPRNKLIEKTAYFAEAWKPRYIVIENVKELLRGRHKHHYQNLHRSLTKQGYRVFSEVHDLKDFGLPQSRIRSLIVAKLDGEFSLDIARVNEFNTVRDAIGHMPPIEAGETHADDPMHVSPKMRSLSMERMKAIPTDGGSWIDLMKNHSHLAIPSMDPKKPGSYPDIYGRLSWDKPAPTVTRECCHPGNGRYSHPEQDRLLSAREMALLQGFLPDYNFMGSLASKYRQIGDAVPPLIASKIAMAILSDSEGIETQSVRNMQLDLAG